MVDNLHNKCKGFLMIELLVGLGLLVFIATILGSYQLQIRLYKQLAVEIYQATNLSERVIEELWAGRRPLQPMAEVVDRFTITTNITQGPGEGLCNVQITIDWQTVLGKAQRLTMESICLI